jgi:2-dehydro-3-deoxy-D-arabinonate dehydratase
MRIGQIRWNNQTTAAVFDDSSFVRPVPDYTVYDLIRLAELEKNSLTDVVHRLVSTHEEPADALLPIHPKEVWACGCTYKISAAFRDAEHGTREGFYAHVFNTERPEIFYKGSARFCVGTNQAIGIRPDSKFTAPEPELALVLGSNGAIVGYTIANDVSAWDIERENPLYLPQSKVYTACCALGPVIVTPDEISDPYQLTIEMTVNRGDQVTFSGKVSTSELNRKFEQLLSYLLRANPVPAGSILLTGTGLIVQEKAALAPGDTVTISIPGIGVLANTAAMVG